jgi:hypothetical protein
MRALRFNAIVPKAELQTSLRLFDCSVCSSLTVRAGAWFQLAVGRSCFARSTGRTRLAPFMFFFTFLWSKKIDPEGRFGYIVSSLDNSLQ